MDRIRRIDALPVTARDPRRDDGSGTAPVFRRGPRQGGDEGGDRQGGQPRHELPEDEHELVDVHPDGVPESLDPGIYDPNGRREAPVPAPPREAALPVPPTPPDAHIDVSA
jgi:hypothetical protein